MLRFATPVMLHKWPDLDDLNRRLRDIILERERTTPGRDVSNMGGWQSDLEIRDGFFAAPDDVRFERLELSAYLEGLGGPKAASWVPVWTRSPRV